MAKSIRMLTGSALLAFLLGTGAQAQIMNDPATPPTLITGPQTVTRPEVGLLRGDNYPKAGWVYYDPRNDSYYYLPRNQGNQ